MLNNIDLNKLKVFYHIYQSRSIKIASGDCNVTPSAVSQALKSLEESLGKPLFIRNNKTIIPTKEADTLYKLTLPYLNSLEKALSDISGVSNAHIFKIGVPLDIGTSKLMAAIKNFNSKLPESKFVIKLGIPRDLIPSLEKNELDFIITDSGPYLDKYPNLDFKNFSKEELGLVCSSKFYKENQIQKLQIKQLMNLNHISYLESDVVLKIWYKHQGFKKINLNTSITVDNIIGVHNAVMNDLGLGLLPIDSIQKDLKNKQLIQIKPKRPLINDILLVTLKGRELSFSEVELIEELKGSI